MRPSLVSQSSNVGSAKKRSDGIAQHRDPDALGGEIVIGHPERGAPAEMADEHASLQAEAEEAIFYILDTYRTDSSDGQRVRVRSVD